MTRVTAGAKVRFGVEFSSPLCFAKESLPLTALHSVMLLSPNRKVLMMRFVFFQMFLNMSNKAVPLRRHREWT